MPIQKEPRWNPLGILPFGKCVLIVFMAKLGG